MPTLLLFSNMTPDCKALWFAARRAGWDTVRFSSSGDVRELAQKEIALYGKPFYAGLLAEALGLALLEPSLDWLTSLPLRFRRREISFTTLGEARKTPHPCFIKPADEPSFPAQVYASGGELPFVDRLPDSLPVLLSEPVQWEVEFRCFVRDRQVLTSSPYLRHGKLARTDDGRWPASSEEQHEALAFAAQVLEDSDVLVPPAFVLDVGKISGRGWAVIEANPAFGSGLYGCDPDQALCVVERTCVNKSRLPESEQRWVIRRKFDPHFFQVLGVQPPS
jgi:hypothetical protein